MKDISVRKCPERMLLSTINHGEKYEINTIMHIAGETVKSILIHVPNQGIISARVQANKC